MYQHSLHFKVTFVVWGFYYIIASCIYIYHLWWDGWLFDTQFLAGSACINGSQVLHQLENCSKLIVMLRNYLE